MSKIFISYSREDGPFVDWLERELESRGHDAWVDRSDIGGGAAWRAEIAQSIRDCDAFVLVFSSRAAASTNISKELALADKYAKAIVPIELERHPVPESMEYQLAGIQRIPLSAENPEAGLVRLLSALPATGMEVAVHSEAGPVGGGSHRRRNGRRWAVLSAVVVFGLVATGGLLWWSLDGSGPSEYTYQNSEYQATRPPEAATAEALQPDRQGADGTTTTPEDMDLTARPQPDDMEVESRIPFPAEAQSEAVDATYSHDRPGLYRVEVPADWLYADFSTFDKTLERFSAPSGIIWLDVELVAAGAAIPDGVLGAYIQAWLAQGMTFTEVGRLQQGDTWMVEGLLSQYASGQLRHCYLLMQSTGLVNANLALFSLETADPELRDRILALVQDSFQLQLTAY